MYMGKIPDTQFSYSLESGGLSPDPGQGAREPYDLDLLYVECRYCGKPVVWEQGKTRSLVKAAGIDDAVFDARCLLLSDGCPLCRPGEAHFYLHVVRLAAFSAPDLLLLGESRGHA